MISFSIQDAPYDLTTYWGRAGSLFQSSNPRYAFKTNSQVLDEVEKINKQKAREAEQFAKTGDYHVQLTAAEVEELRHARNIVNCAIHPDTGKPIPMPMRYTFFLPSNIPISMGFLFAAPTMYNTVFWQVVNQTNNALLNYGNANKSSPATNADIFKSYCMAVTASCSSAAAVRIATKTITSNSTGGKLVVLNGIVSTIACMCGGFANNYFMRQPEIKNGIKIQDPSNDEIMGSSQLCAKNAIMQTASSRILLAAPVGLPGYIIFGLERKGLYPKNWIAALILQLSLISVQLLGALPLSLAAFNQITTIKADKLEPEFRNMRSSKTGELITEFKFNKGL